MKKSKCGEIHNSIPRKVVTKQSTLRGRCPGGLPKKKDQNLVVDQNRKKKRRRKKKSKVPPLGMLCKVAKQQRAQSTLALLEYKSTVAAVAAS